MGLAQEEPGDWKARALRRAGIALLALTGLGVFAFIALAAYTWHLMDSVPSKEDLLEARVAAPSVLMSSDGQPLAVFRLEKQERIRLDQVSPFVLKALISTEDRRFYEHRGIDLPRTVMAALNTAAGDLQGGSTITQQLARNLFPDEIGRERSLKRKLKEAITAVRIERLYSKKQILETYLNTAPFLYSVVGIEMAARTYFDKSAAELNLLESATLIGMLKGSYRYNPVLNPDRSVARRNVVLASMVADGHISETDRHELRARPLLVRFNLQAASAGPAPHFAEHVRKWLIDWADQHDYDIFSDGLVVQTTIDSRLQQAALQAVERQAGMLQAVADVEWAKSGGGVASTKPEAYEKLRAKVTPFEHFWKSQKELLATFLRESPEYAAARRSGSGDADALAALQADARFMAGLRAEKTRLEASFLAMDPASGEVRAWVGSRNFETDQFDHAAQAKRQPGSTFKPFVYAAALERGFGPERAYIDAPVSIPLPDGKFWTPTDMGGSSGESMTLRDGLVRSKNTITVQVARDVGTANIATLAQAMGVDRSKLDPVPSLVLGTSPVTLMEMVSGYATIAGSGEHRDPVFVKRILDRHGKVLAEFGTKTRRALSEQAAVQLIDIMRGVITSGTAAGMKARFGNFGDVGGKTGTTQRNTDGWFILMHPNLVAGAWVGFNDTRVTMRSSYWGQGAHNALFIVGDFFKEVLAKGHVDAKAQFPRPPMRVAASPAPQAAPKEEQPADAPAVAMAISAKPVISAAERNQFLERVPSVERGPTVERGPAVERPAPAERFTPPEPLPPVERPAPIERPYVERPYVERPYVERPRSPERSAPVERLPSFGGFPPVEVAPPPPNPAPSSEAPAPRDS
jgi:penicillin-binding protein 1A